LLRDPEGQRRDAWSDRHGHGLVAVGVLLLLPPDELVLPIAHHDDGCGAAGGGKSLRDAIAVTALRHHGRNFRETWKETGDRALGDILRPVTIDRAGDLELRMLFDAG